MKPIMSQSQDYFDLFSLNKLSLMHILELKEKGSSHLLTESTVHLNVV